jgi:hypothetical protein
MQAKPFQTGEFLRALGEGSLAEPITREGVAKPDPGDPKAFLFSEGGSCGPWLKVPGEVVESVDFLRTVPCKDHEHPFVRLHLKRPGKDHVLARFLADLGQLARRNSSVNRRQPIPDDGPLWNGSSRTAQGIFQPRRRESAEVAHPIRYGVGTSRDPRTFFAPAATLSKPSKPVFRLPSFLQFQWDYPYGGLLDAFNVGSCVMNPSSLILYPNGTIEFSANVFTNSECGFLKSGPDTFCISFLITRSDGRQFPVTNPNNRPSGWWCGPNMCSGRDGNCGYPPPQNFWYCLTIKDAPAERILLSQAYITLDGTAQLSGHC